MVPLTHHKTAEPLRLDWTHRTGVGSIGGIEADSQEYEPTVIVPLLLGTIEPIKCSVQTKGKKLQRSVSFRALPILECGVSNQDAAPPFDRLQCYLKLTI